MLELISDSYPHSHKAVSIWGEVPKIYFFFNLMLNLSNNENDAVFDEICKKKTTIKIKFQKMKSTFLDCIPCLKSHQPPLEHTHILIVINKIYL